MPRFIMVSGIAGAGKSTWAHNYLKQVSNPEQYVLLSSDGIRKELYGDEATQGNPEEVFTQMNLRAIKAIYRGQNVIYDATNLKRAHRMAILRRLRAASESGQHYFRADCYVINTPLARCLQQNKQRARNVPEDVIRRQFGQEEPVTYSEGWNNIYYVELNPNKGYKIKRIDK